MTFTSIYHPHFETTILILLLLFFISIWIMSCNICWLLPSNLRPDDILRGSLLEMLQLARSPWGVLPILASPLGSHHPEHGIHIPVASSYKTKNKRKKHQQQAEVCQSWSLLCGATTENMGSTIHIPATSSCNKKRRQKQAKNLPILASPLRIQGATIGTWNSHVCTTGDLHTKH